MEEPNPVVSHELVFYSHLNPFPELNYEELTPSTRWSGARLVPYRYQYKTRVEAPTEDEAKARVLELDPMAEFRARSSGTWSAGDDDE